MILYVDTSALVKLYVPEPRVRRSRRLEERQVAAVSPVAFAEAQAAFASKRKERAVSPKDYRRIVREFDDDWDHYFVVDVTEPLVRRAAQLADKHGLRGYDAIHLPRRSCCATRAASRGVSAVSTIDYCARAGVKV